MGINERKTTDDHQKKEKFEIRKVHICIKFMPNSLDKPLKALHKGKRLFMKI